MQQTDCNRLYFAYGLNLDLATIKQKCSKPQVLGVARLAGYRLAFFEHTSVWDGAMETIVPEEGAQVWGVLYSLNLFDWEELDNHEDARMDGTGAYFHYPVTVETQEGTLLDATVYLKARWGQSNHPSSEYMAVVCKAAREQGLPDSYIDFLERIETKPAAYVVPKRPGRIMQAAGDCSGCSACE